MNRFLFSFFFTSIWFVCTGQSQTVVIDGDKIQLRDSLEGKVVLMSYIERGEQNKDELWITYDRRPRVDPWIQDAVDRSNRYSENIFVEYWKEMGIRILGAITTYDDCQCVKHKALDSPDMF